MSTDTWKVKGDKQPALVGSFADHLTDDNNYADVDSVHVARINIKTFAFTATTNNLLVNVLGSIDNGVTYSITLEADIAVAAAATVVKTYVVSASVPYVTDIKIQVKPASANQHGTLSTKYAGALL